MSMMEDWRRISARIDSLRDAALFYMQRKTPDSTGAVKDLLNECRTIADSCSAFATQYDRDLSNDAKGAISDCLKAASITVLYNSLASLREFESSVAVLKLLQGRLAYALSDQQEVLRKRSYRALTHLQWTLAADEAVRDKWQDAFENKTEPSCERLGAVHLLSHGIYAFKADAVKGRTDLMFAEVDPSEEVTQTDAALVLTEWKIAKVPGEAAKKFQDARDQARRYKAHGQSSPRRCRNAPRAW
jgi:hypothetical protein